MGRYGTVQYCIVELNYYCYCYCSQRQVYEYMLAAVTVGIADCLYGEKLQIERDGGDVEKDDSKSEGCTSMGDSEKWDVIE